MVQLIISVQINTTYSYFSGFFSILIHTLPRKAMGNFFVKNPRKNSEQNEKPQMDEVFLRFGHIGDQIFEELNSQTLSKCQMVGRSWNLFLDQGKVRPFRIIETYINIDKKYLRNRIKKINVEKANE